MFNFERHSVLYNTLSLQYIGMLLWLINFHHRIIGFFADIAECDANNGGCGQFCREFQGSFQCYCGVGYTLATDGRNCDGKQFLILWFIYTAEFGLRFRLRFGFQTQWLHCTMQKFSYYMESDPDSNPNCQLQKCDGTLSPYLSLSLAM